MQVLPEVLHSMPSQVALKLAVFASRKGLLDLEKWLEEEVSIRRDSFASVCCLLLLILVFFGCFVPLQLLGHSWLRTSML